MDVAVYVKKTDEEPDEEKLLIWLMGIMKGAYKIFLTRTNLVQVHIV